MSFKCDDCLAAIVICLNFYMLGIQESSLYTILPKYLVDEPFNATNNETFKPNTSRTIFQCHLQKPPYFIVSMIFLSKSLAQFFFNSIIGCFVDKVNNFIILLIGQGLGIIIALIYALNNSITMYIVGRLLDAFVSCSLFIGGFSIVSKLFSNVNTRGRFFGLGNTLYFVSHSIGPVYGAEVDVRLGKSAVFFLLIPLWIFTMAATFILYRRTEKRCNKSKNNFNEKLSIGVTPDETNELDDHNELKVAIIISSNSKMPEKYSDFKGEKKFQKENNEIFMKFYKIMKNPYVSSCLCQLFIVNLSMFALPATLPSWMGFRLCATEIQQGLVWAFGFIGYVSGVGLIVLLLKCAYQLRFFSPIIAQIIVGILLILLPLSHDWRLLFIPIIGMYFSVGVIEQVLFPLTTYLADHHFNSDYGSMASLTSQSLTLSGVVGTLSSGPIAQRFGFRSLCICLGILNLLFCLLSLPHQKLVQS
uniref:Slc18a-1 n=1 Tax=Schmidtea mediterranea TaxID=79327 RepID=A0A0H3YJ27_SCHMD|nr:slc18a-1 [Schmidtea mediterranea]